MTNTDTRASVISPASARPVDAQHEARLVQTPGAEHRTGLIIRSPYNGPPNSAHGGVAAGHMAALVDADRACVRFHSPPPLDEALHEVYHPDGTVAVFAGTRRVATVSPTPSLAIDPFERLDSTQVAVGESRWLDLFDGHHPFPTCFGCGTSRFAGGLDLQPGSVPGTSVHATFWTPSVDGPVPSWLVWAALDCPSGGPALALVPTGSAVVTGELTVEVRQPLLGRTQYQVQSRCTAASGRTFSTQAAIVDAHGRNVAVASATWIAVAPNAGVAS